MDSLLLLCRVDAILVRGSGMFMHSVRGCVRAYADCNCVGSAKSLHSVDWEYMQGDSGPPQKSRPVPSGSQAGCPEFFDRTTEPD
ncbi:unnamed protein product [Heligmosomoides polygyrus]|uniref:Secreted protein n=1 Tax=Heligmosomoides polygyrus TaxID=6339 RepID=A0A183G6R1_HELPZ|nr:unnamed protein product [Heligmosomoides polygyrus]